MKIFLSIIILNITLIAYPSADTVIAKVGGLEISSKEFRQRFELTPQISKKGINDINLKKEDFLYSLIAEKLWALEAENLKLDTTGIMKHTFKAIEKMYVRDALYQNEILNKLEITDAELIEGMNRKFTDLIVDVIFSEDSSDIFSVLGELNSGVHFDSTTNLNSLYLPPLEISYDEMEPEVENILYSLDVDEYTAPIKTANGWFIFKLANKSERSFTSEDINKSLKEIDNKIKDRKKEKLVRELTSNLFGGKKVKVNGELFLVISDNISGILSRKKNDKNIQDSSVVYFQAEDILTLERELGPDTLNLILVQFETDPVNIKDFLRDFIFNGFYTIDTNEDLIAAKLNSRVKTFIEAEFLAREGYRRGLHNQFEVKKSITMWRENYLAKILKNNLVDSLSVTDKEVYDYYLSLDSTNSGGATEVNIIEILTDSLSVIETVLDQIETEEDFREMAIKHTKRIWTKDSGGEFGFFPASLYGDIGRIAGEMEVGEVYGPLKVDEGYSIFKLIGKREPEKETLLPFEESKEKLKAELTQKKLSKFFIDYTVELANKYDVNIDASNFRSLRVNDFKLYTIRHMCFGGRITAVPLTIPFYQWAEEWEKSKREMP